MLSIKQKIHILPDFIANQIAAGEVVQKPESVVKELVENSLDAGATEIAVILKNAGKTLIQIVDNGFGISEEDLPLTIKRHATSKILTSEDLEQIYTYGFRGEALASIASVAQIEIKTKQEDKQLGLKLHSEPNSEAQIEPFLCDNGTQILVKNLFYNVPARRKFLKSNMTEFRYSMETMLKFALSKPNISFTFYDENNLIFTCKKESLFTRIQHLMGQEISENLLEVNHKDDTFEIYGYIGLPKIAKSGRSGQYLFLNGRSIQSNLINHAIYSCYDSAIEKSYKPFFVLNLVLNPKHVDINIHPQKHEVKFEDERYIYNLFKNTVSNALYSQNLIPVFSFESDLAKQPFIKIDEEKEELFVNRSTGEVFSNQSNFQSKSNTGSYYSDNSYPSQNKLSAFDKLFTGLSSQEVISSNLDFEIDKNYLLIHNQILIKQSKQGAVFIDLKAAFRRKVYNSLQDSGQSNSQILLFPIELKFAESDLKLINDFQSNIEELGFKILIKEQSINIDAMPNGFDLEYLQSYFRNTLDYISELNEFKEINEKLKVKHSTLFASQLIKSVNELEILDILQKIKDAQFAIICPIGDTIYKEVNLFELQNILKNKIF